MEQSCKHQFIIRERPLTDLRQHSHCDVYGRARQMLDVSKHLRDVSSQQCGSSISLSNLMPGSKVNTYTALL